MVSPQPYNFYGYLSGCVSVRVTPHQSVWGAGSHLSPTHLSSAVSPRGPALTLCFDARRPLARESCLTLMGQAMAVHAAGFGTLYAFLTCNTELCNVFQTPPVLQMPLPPPAPAPVLPPPPYPPFPPQPPATAGTAHVYTEADFRTAIADPSVVRFVVMSARISLSGSVLDLTRPLIASNVYRDVIVESAGRFPCPSDVAWSRLPAEAHPALCPAVIDAGGLSQVFVLNRGSLVMRDLIVMNGRQEDIAGGGCLMVQSIVTLVRLEGVIFSKCYSSGARIPSLTARRSPAAPIMSRWTHAPALGLQARKRARRDCGSRAQFALPPRHPSPRRRAAVQCRPGGTCWLPGAFSLTARVRRCAGAVSGMQARALLPLRIGNVD